MSEIFELVKPISGSNRISVQPLNGLTVAQVVDLLNSRKASISGDQIIQRAPAPAEGSTVLAQITARKSELPDTQWQVESKTADHSCCSVSPEEQTRFQADQLRYRADLLIAGKGDPGQAEALLKSAGVLLDLSGGRENEPGIWLTASEASLAQQRGDTAAALALLKTAHDKAKSILGAEDPSTLACLGNYAQALVESGDSGGSAVLSDAILKLRQAKPARSATQQWIDSAIAEFSTSLAKLSAPSTTPATAGVE